MIVSTPHDEPLALCKGLFTSEKEGKLPDNIIIIVKNFDDGKMVGTYRPKKNGTFVAALKPNNHYVFSYQINGEEFCRENIFIGPDNNYQITKQELDLETITVFESKKMQGFEK
jgi:hypothetical protein